MQILTELKEGSDSLAVRAHLLLAEILIEEKDKVRALSVIKELKDLTDNEAVAARIQFIEAKAKYEADEFDEAAAKFSQIEENKTGDVATYNSAVASLRAGDDKKFLARAAQLPEVTGQLSRGDL